MNCSCGSPCRDKLRTSSVTTVHNFTFKHLNPVVLLLTNDDFNVFRIRTQFMLPFLLLLRTCTFNEVGPALLNHLLSCTSCLHICIIYYLLQTGWVKLVYFHWSSCGLQCTVVCVMWWHFKMLWLFVGDHYLMISVIDLIVELEVRLCISVYVHMSSFFSCAHVCLTVKVRSPCVIHSLPINSLMVTVIIIIIIIIIIVI
jgi:hypothetical protein